MLSVCCPTCVAAAAAGCVTAAQGQTQRTNARLSGEHEWMGGFGVWSDSEGARVYVLRVRVDGWVCRTWVTGWCINIRFHTCIVECLWV